MYTSSTLTSLCKAHARSHLAAWDTLPVVAGQGKVQPKSWTGQQPTENSAKTIIKTRQQKEAATAPALQQKQRQGHLLYKNSIQSTTRVVSRFGLAVRR